MRPLQWVASATAAAMIAAAILATVPTGVRAQPPPAAAEFPSYEVAACCQLCPQAADPANYNTKFLDSFRTLVQGRDGWLFRSEADLLTDFAPDPSGLERLARFRRALSSRGVELVMMVQPPRGLMHADKLRDGPYAYDADAARSSYRRTLQGLRSHGVVVPDLERLLSEPAGEDYFWRNDHHWTPEGTRRTAALVAERIRQLPQYAQLPRQRFVSRREGLLARGGTLSDAASDLCGYGAPKQYAARYVTEPASDDASGDLFGDQALPQVTLVGTSNSGATYNFGGFLSEYLQTDVLNASVLGGGMDGAMLSYLPSEEFRNNPPRVLIWELQHFHKLGDPLFYRQAMPLLDGGCEGRPALLEREVTLKPGNNEVLFNGGGGMRALRGRDHLLDLRFSDPARLELRATVWYTSGEKDPLRIDHAAHAPSHQGRFVAELRSDGHWGDQTFLGLDVEQPLPEAGTPAATSPAAPLRLRARLCARDERPAAMRTAAAAGAAP